jgi:hypothetical protein
MKYAVGMGSSVMIYITKFRKDWFSHSNVNKGGTHRHTDIRLLLFFQNKKIKLINKKKDKYYVMLY